MKMVMKSIMKSILKSRLQVLLLPIFLLIPLKGHAHGSIPMPSCLIGSAPFVDSSYKCEIEFKENRNTKTFTFADIFSQTAPGWEGSDGILASYKTSAGSEIRLFAVVSCPADDQLVDPDSIDLMLESTAPNGDAQTILHVNGLAVPKKGELTFDFFLDDDLAGVKCLLK